MIMRQPLFTKIANLLVIISLMCSLLALPNGQVLAATQPIKTGDPINDVTEGLIDYWSGDGNAEDSVGNHDGTLVNGTGFVNGRFGQAFSFDGSNDSIELGNWFNLQDFSISLWVKPDSAQTYYANIIDNNHQSGINWVLQQNQSTQNQYFWSGQVGFYLTSDLWHHIVIIHDSSGIFKTYLNGALIGSSQGGAINYDGNQFLRLGAWGGGGRNWKGSMDEIRVYNRSLSAAEAGELYEAGAVNCNAADLVIPDGYSCVLTPGAYTYNSITVQKQRENSSCKGIRPITAASPCKWVI